MGLRHAPSEHWLRAPFEEIGCTEWPPPWTSFPLGGGLSPQAFRFMRLLLVGNNPSMLPVDVAPFSQPDIMELDRFCLETLLETLQALQASAEAESEAVLSAGYCEGNLPKQLTEQLANFHMAQASLIAENIGVLKRLLLHAANCDVGNDFDEACMASSDEPAKKKQRTLAET
eukprot:TRINITY_DN27377_c0_g1_i1.p1 TRINITY_DN27377_c0_g1~~TRINITY_DN27377_c0_g1_i1.p1  ORF type:complete len:173 (+),score=27.99 TRINITY_DN27377_c0_g1_i1:233-751(+)